ncbi:MAG: DUF1192 family protein [Caulobacteraceae bacterium]
MFEDAAQPRPRRGEALDALLREDLELYGREELEERIERLKAEIARAQAQLDSKHQGRAAADALFSIRRE